MLYAAYGSNTNLEQMAYRCPTAKVVGVGIANGYRLVFNYHADIIPEQCMEAIVLVWDINSKSEWETLRRYEGYPKYYVEETISVTMEDGHTKDCIVYVMAENRKGFCFPSLDYWNTIMDGFEANNMDIGYMWEALDYTDNMIGDEKEAEMNE